MKMKKTARAQQKKGHAAASKKNAIVYIVGDAPLVDEYAYACVVKGYEVHVHLNVGQGRGLASSPHTLKRSRIPPRATSLALELTNLNLEQKRHNVEMLDKSLDSSNVILSSSVCLAATEQASWLKHRHRLVGLGALPSFSERPLVEVAPTMHTPRETLDVVQRFFRSLGKELEVVQDRVGMVLPRIVCQVINEATFTLMEDVATPEDIDTAMKLGTNYPFGPIEWADRIGIRHVHAVLSALARETQEDRYRISPLLTRMAAIGEPWKQHTPNE
jgi:3-hydroxybutyryl-CoA dehydrogenase